MEPSMEHSMEDSTERNLRCTRHVVSGADALLLRLVEGLPQQQLRQRRQVHLQRVGLAECRQIPGRAFVSRFLGACRRRTPQSMQPIWKVPTGVSSRPFQCYPPIRRSPVGVSPSACSGKKKTNPRSGRALSRRRGHPPQQVRRERAIGRCATSCHGLQARPAVLLEPPHDPLAQSRPALQAVCRVQQLEHHHHTDRETRPQQRLVRWLKTQSHCRACTRACVRACMCARGHACIRPSVRPFVRPSVRPSVRPCVRACVHARTRVRACHSVTQSIRRSVCPSIRRFARPSVRVCVSE